MNAPKQVTVTIVADNHKHAGQPIAKGESLTVDETTAKWMVDNKIASVSAGQADARKESR